MNRLWGCLVLAAVSVLWMLPASGGEASGRKIAIQAISARPGDNRTSDDIDPKLAAKLRITLETLGVAKPDLTDLAKTEKAMGRGDVANLSAQGYSVEVVCKSDDAAGGTFDIELFEERENPSTKRKERRSLNRHSVTLKGDEVWPVTPAQSGKNKLIFVLWLAQ